MKNDQVIRQVGDHRAATRADYPEPDGANNLIFALTEAGELFDAWQRQKAGFSRNNARKVDPAEELGDLGYQLASAVVAMYDARPGIVARPEITLADICDRIALAINALSRGFLGPAIAHSEHAIALWLRLCGECELDPRQLLDEHAAKIDAKIDRDKAGSPAAGAGFITLAYQLPTPAADSETWRRIDATTRRMYEAANMEIDHGAQPPESEPAE